MKTNTFRRVLMGVCANLGSNLDSLTEAEAAAYVECINNAVESAWSAYDWPELCPTEPFSAVASGQRGVIDWAGDDKGDVLQAFDADPLIGPANELDFCLTQGGIVLDRPGTVFLRHRLRAPSWSAEAWDANTTYAPGEVVYSPVTGHGYQARVPSMGQAVSDPAAWTQLSFPAVLAQFVKAEATGLLLQGREGQTGSAQTWRVEAQRVLQQKLYTINLQQNQRTFWRRPGT